MPAGGRRAGRPGGWAAFLRRHERALAWGWLVGAALLVGLGFAAAYVAEDAFAGILRRRWDARVERAAELVRAGRFAEAEPALEELDRELPARWVKERLVPSRARVLELLAACHAAAGRKGRTLATLERLLALDPRDWRRSHLVARAALHFDDQERARAALADVLALHPSHLPSVEALALIELEAGRFAAIPPLVRAYLDAWLALPGELCVGGAAFPFHLPVDGRAHALELALPGAAADASELVLASGGYSFELLGLELEQARRAGVAGAAARLALASGEGWSARGAQSVAPGRWSAQTREASVRRALPALAAPPVRARLELRAFKPCSERLWEAVETAYRNLLDDEGLARVRARTLLGGVRGGDERYDAPPWEGGPP